MAASDAARSLFALQGVSEGLARSLLDDLVSGDARLRWIGSAVGIARPEKDPLLEEADYVVFDLETTGLGRGARICEIGAVRISALEQTATFETLVDPRADLPAAITALTGIRQADLRGAPSAAVAVRRFMAFAGDAVLVAHNARFDRSFLDRDLDRLTGKRLAAPVLDTLALARTLLAGRVARTGLASLSYFFGTHAQPCHRALPDAEATGEILLALIGLAQERGARTISDLYELGAPRKRKVYDKRSLAHGAPQRPGVYRFCAGAASALRRPRARPAGATSLVLPLRAPAAVGRGRALRGRPHRVGRARLGARGRARGAAAHPGAAPAGERAAVAARPLRLSAAARRRDRGLADARRDRPDPQPPPGRARRAGARGRVAGGAGQPARPRRALSRDCARSSATCPTACATRTRHGCATASRRSSGSCAISAGCSSCAPWSSASSPRQSNLGCGARSSSRAGASRPCGQCRPERARRSSWRRALPPRARARSSWTRNRWTSSCSSARSCSDRRQSSSCAPSRGARPGARPDPVLRFPHRGPRYGCPRAKGDLLVLLPAAFVVAQPAQAAARSRPRSTSRARPSRQRMRRRTPSSGGSSRRARPPFG